MTPLMIRLPAVKEMTGMATSTIYAMMGQGRFPKPMKLGRRAVAWRVEDIEAWVSSRAEGVYTPNADPVVHQRPQGPKLQSVPTIADCMREIAKLQFRVDRLERDSKVSAAGLPPRRA